MKKRYRDIVVGGVDYAWTVKRANPSLRLGPGLMILRIYFDRSVKFAILVPDEVPIKPSMVKYIINSGIEIGQHKLMEIKDIKLYLHSEKIKILKNNIK